MNRQRISPAEGALIILLGLVVVMFIALAMAK